MSNLNGLIIHPNGDKIWYKDGRYHREDGPAVEYANGDKVLFQNGQYHRMDGPALVGDDGYVEFWIKDKEIICESEEEFLKLVKLKAFW